MKKVEYHGNPVSIIDFDRFVDLLPVTEVSIPEGVNLEYNALVGYGNPSLNEGQDVADYKRLSSPLVLGDKTAVLKTALMYTANQGHLFHKEEKELFELLVLKHLEELGVPDFVVKMADNTYMTANPVDFKVIYNGRGAYGLQCLALNRAVIYRVNPRTKEEAMAELNEHIEALGSSHK